MIDELNKIIESESIKINPFNEKGVSANLYINEVFYLFCDQKNNVLRLYTNVMKVDSYYKEQSPLLYCLLQFNGPQVVYPELKVGFDLDSDFLWISAAISLDYCSQGQHLKERIQSFQSHSASLKEEVIQKVEECISNSVAPPYTDNNKVSDNSTDSDSGTINKGFSTKADPQELVTLMSNTQMYWG